MSDASTTLIKQPAAGQAALPTKVPEVGLTDVLVIDDDDAVRGVVSEILRRNGYTYKIAADGKSAMALLARDKFRLVVTDIYMPDMDGLELIMKYTAKNPNALILAISGGCRGHFAESSLKPAQLLGSTRTLAKPFGLTEFLTVIHEMLGSKSS